MPALREGSLRRRLEVLVFVRRNINDVLRSCRRGGLRVAGGWPFLLSVRSGDTRTHYLTDNFAALV